MKADQTIKVYLLWQVLTSFVHNILKKWKETSKHFSFQLTTYCPWKKKIEHVSLYWIIFILDIYLFNFNFS